MICPDHKIQIPPSGQCPACPIAKPSPAVAVELAIEEAIKAGELDPKVVLETKEAIQLGGSGKGKPKGDDEKK